MPTDRTLADTREWFRRAVPHPTEKNRAVQIGCHLEETSEMSRAIGDDVLTAHLEPIAYAYKHGRTLGGRLGNVDREALLDALCDQIVTAVGVAHMFGFDIAGALAEVNRSNWSKFVGGQPVFNDHGKIAKGPEYAPPDLIPFLGTVQERACA